jgi:predicted RNase H-like nuclease
VKTTFIGIDLAWKSARNPTGAAVLNGDHSGARLEVLSTLSPQTSVADFIIANATANTVLAIDAPLVIVNKTGQRACETAIGKKYGSRDASCHTSNLRLYPDASSTVLTAALLTHGFTHVDRATTKESGRLMVEVYPHAAMVALWDLPKTIKYKKGSVSAKRLGLSSLQSHLTTLSKTVPPLLWSGMLQEVLSTDLNDLVGQSLKNHEDQLDALFCAYLAYYFWYWGWKRTELFGDLRSGYILNPTSQSIR